MIRGTDTLTSKRNPACGEQIIIGQRCHHYSANKINLFVEYMILLLIHSTRACNDASERSMAIAYNIKQ